MAGCQFFYMRVGRLMRLATKIVKAVGIVTRNRTFKSTCLASRYKLVNGEKVSYHGIFYYLQCGKPTSFLPPVFLLTARWYGELPSASGLACVFAKSWLTDASFLVQIKLSR